MPTIRYRGPHDGVDLEDGQTVARGRTVVVSTDLARRLLEQTDNFAAVAPPRKRKTTAPAPKTPED